MAPGVGHINCPACGDVSIVRKKAPPSGKLYIVCGNCGMLDIVMPRGQDYILKNATMWTDHSNPPADLPLWIRENRAWRYPPGQYPVDEELQAPTAAPAAAPAVAAVAEAVVAASPSPAPVPAPKSVKRKPATVAVPVAAPAVEDDDDDGGLFGKGGIL
jgi:hypothetical protein